MNLEMLGMQIIIIIFIISRTATQPGRAVSYTPEGASRLSSPVRKMKRKEREKYKSIQLKKYKRKKSLLLE